MKDSGVYLSLWGKYKAAIVSKLKSSIETPQEYQLSKHEFETFGRRPVSEFKFILKITDGKIEYISKSAVARDLFDTLKQSAAANALWNEHHFQIEMDSKFALRIQTC